MGQIAIWPGRLNPGWRARLQKPKANKASIKHTDTEASRDGG